MSVKETDGVAITGSSGSRPADRSSVASGERPILSMPSASGGIGKWIGVAILAIIVGLIVWGVATGNLS